jgi:predicted transcriptional regulator
MNITEMHQYVYSIMVPTLFSGINFSSGPSKIRVMITCDYKSFYYGGVMETTEPITIRTSKDVVSQIDALAAGMDRSRNYVVNQAIQQYLAYHHVLHQKIEQGLNEAKEGRLTAAEDVMAEIRSRRARQHK